ncbi:PKD domain-containing protein [Algoriphagus sp. D3-2-R+10]|uniref:PKD domain-containing protein n=1 Tax=Algoriphagus aurantiacus TaxID=3103948 RepID=UPI002B37F62A|nr:PKD domain-containing protein [Algoriphagus sp. D3-2-R+10]MEB2777514.1 PKD domain-containing protein [Algoriphagus sp. D3-2-R+10]
MRIIAVFLLFLLETADLFSQNIITIREGFPYCESFETLTPRANTVIDGSRREDENYVSAIPKLTGNSLQLTSNLPEESGHVFIDYPFASNRGVKVSFEYSSYGKTKTEGADGLSFFMFDGSIDPSTFEIGGKGGALGYTPRKAESSPGIYEMNEPGLKGAYLGIGLDEFGNFGNHYENKRYGFLGKDPMDPISSWSSPPTPIDRFKHTVVLRGPVMANDINRNDAFNYSSYEFITGKFLAENVYPGVDSKYLTPVGSPVFTIDTNSDEAIFDCNTIGYRKVFIDLQPDPISGYKVNVWMLVNTSGTPQLINVIEDEPYPFIPPPFLKIGFAASTGGSNNFHEIKNVSVEVSESEGQDPISLAYVEEVCQGGELEFQINPTVEDDAYIRCIQLYPTIAEANAAKNSADLINSAQTFDCGISGKCFIELCDQDLLTAPTEFGDFETFMEEDNDGNFTQKIRFQSSGILSTTGQVTVYYTVIDNFGQMSAPQSITIDVVPLPEPQISTIDPLTWEESEIDEIYVTLEAMPKGSAYQWFKNGIPVPGAIEETFLVQGNEGIGAYTVEVTTEEGCVGLSSEEVKILLISDISPEHVTNRETCSDEGALTIQFDPSSLVGDEKWQIVNSVGEQIYPVAGVWSFFSTEQLSTGQVVVSNLLTGDYIFQVGDSFREGQLGSDGNPLFRHQIPFTIEPIESPVAINLTKVDEICYGEGGSIFVESSGGLGLYTYELYKDGTLVMESTPSLSQSSYEFVDVPVGIYEIIVTSGDRCQAFETAEILPQVPIDVEVSNFKNITCTDNDGFIEWIASGGSGVYSFVSLSRDGNVLDESEFILTQNGENSFTTSNLSVGIYTLVILDDQGCSVNSTSNQLISSEPKPELSIDFPEEICEGEDVLLEASLINFGLITNPEYTWISPWGDRITNDVTINGVDFSPRDHDSNPLTPPYLSISGLNSGTYEFSLEMSGENSCDPISEISLKVNAVPQAEYSTVTVSCFGGADGQISVGSIEPPTGDFSFTLLETGERNSTGNFNNLQAGDYTIRIKDISASCYSDKIVQINQPPFLEINEIDKTDASCGENNGEISFEIMGGSPDASWNYDITINGNNQASFGADFVETSDGIFTLSNLAPTNYQIEVSDSRGCPIELSISLEDIPTPVFDVEDTIICVETDAILTPITVSNIIGASPIFEWFVEDINNPGQYIQINNGDGDGEISYSINSGILTISGLLNLDSPYTYYLGVTGDQICTSDLIPAQIEVIQLPNAEFSSLNVSCFGGSDGQIILNSIEPTGNFTFTILETGETNTIGSFSNLSDGNYTIRIREDAANCFSEEVIEIKQPDELIITDPQATNPTCGQSNGSIQFDITGGTPDYEILVNGNPISDFSSSISGTTVELKNLSPATYSVLVRDANNCELTASNLMTLENDDGVEVNMNPLNEVVCVGADAVLIPTYSTSLPVVPVLKWYRDSTLTQSITNGTDAAGVGYQIDSTNGELTIQDLQIGDYTYYVEISGPGICSKVETATVEVFPEITATIEVKDVICFGDSNGSIQISPAGGNGNFEVSLNSSPFTASTSYTDLPAGSYTVAIRNDVGCLTEIEVEILAPSEAISINNPTIIRASCGLENGSISDLVISGGWGDYNVEWRKGSATGPLVTGGLTGAVDLTPDTYFLLVSDSEGCSAEFPLVVEQSSDPVYAVVPPINSCTGSPVEIRPIHIAPDPTLPPAAATEVRWYTGPGQTGLIQNGPDPSLDGVTYTIDDTDWLNPELLVEGLPAGAYKYYFYVVCTGQEIEIEVIAYDTPDVELETDKITCFGDTNGKVQVISGADPSYTYSIDGATPISLTELESQSFVTGNYTLVVATPAGCAQDLNFVIEGPAAPLTASPLTKIDPGCGALNGKLILTITGGWAPYSLEVFKNGISEDIITTSESNITLDEYATGVYKIEITDVVGCVISTNEVTLVDGPTQVLVTHEVICEGEVATLTPTLDPAASGSTFQWFIDQGLTQEITSSPNPTADGRIYQINAGTGTLTIAGLTQTAIPITYYVTASGPTVCPGFIGQGSVIVGGSPAATALVVDEVCFGDGGTITVNASGGSGNYTYSLNGGTFGSSNVFDVDPGTYSIEVRSQEGCSYTLDDVEVIGPPAVLSINSLLQDNASCSLDNGEIRFNIEGGYTPYSVSYSKNGTSAGIITSPDGKIRISNLGQGTYSWTITDSQGCELISSSPITITEVPTIITANGDQICEGETAELIASVPQNIPDPQFTWSFDSEGNNPIIPGEVNGVTYDVGPDGQLNITGLLGSGSPYTYYVSATGTGICGLSPKPVLVTMSPVANLKVSNPSVVCDPNGRVDLTDYIEGFNSAVYDYNVLSPSGSAMQIDEIENVAVSGDYRVSSSLKGSSCWNQPQRIRVLIAETELIASFEYEVDLGGGNVITNGDVQILEDVQFQDLTQGNAILWNWDFGDGSTSAEQSPVHQFQEKGTYNVILTSIDNIGCQSDFQIIVNVFDDYMVIVPNAFTPDGTKNQFFKPQFRGIASIEFYIFNTWGELIYEAKSLEDIGWDGTLNGVTTPNGNYVYRGRFISRSGEIIEKSGVFVLIR